MMSSDIANVLCALLLLIFATPKLQVAGQNVEFLPTPIVLAQEVQTGCPDIDIENGRAQLRTFTDLGVTTATLRFLCTPPYIRNGIQDAECASSADGERVLVNGAVPPTCEPPPCGQPPSIENGRREFNGTVYLNKAVYRCNPGYTIQGKEELECQANGTWTGPAPTCCVRCRAQLPVNFLANSQSVTRSASVPHCGQTAADIIVVVDESKSMKPHYKERLHEAFTRLDVSLEEHGIGLYPGKPNQYTVVGFGHSEGRTSVNGVHRYVPHVLYSNNGRQVYDINGFQEACSKLQTTGSLEDGYLAMKFALEDITSGGRQLLRLRREDIAPVIIFISDEDRDTHQQGAGISRSAIKRVIRKSGATMEAIVDNNVWYNNQRGFGMDSSGTLYVAESTTQYTTSNPRFYKRYLDLHYRT
eukprot:scpid88808/ scgid30534/ 